jgi:hypothetical protein
MGSSIKARVCRVSILGELKTRDVADITIVGFRPLLTLFSTANPKGQVAIFMIRDPEHSHSSHLIVNF